MRPLFGLSAASLLLAMVCAGQATAEEFTLQSIDIAETKAVFGRVETRDLAPARTRIGGILTRRDVSEGASVEQGQPIGLVVDDKLALQLRASAARVRALNAEQANAKNELERAQSLLARGAATQQRVDQLRTQVDVLYGQIGAAEAEQSVLVQQGVDGEIKAPAKGVVLRAPVTVGSVVLPGDMVAMVAGGGFFLRLALPERHAASLRAGQEVQIGEGKKRSGRIAKIFPQIENGRVIADIETDSLGTYFVGERVMVHVPVARRLVLAVPEVAIQRRAGLDLVTLATKSGQQSVVVVTGQRLETPAGPQIEILSGLVAGDRVVTP